jgi:hypothetical protein
MVWKIEGYRGTEKILDQRIPLNDATEQKVSEMLKRLASQHLTEAEISAGLADVRADSSHGNRIILMAGQDPHYVAGLFRSDELDDDADGSAE